MSLYLPTHYSSVPNRSLGGPIKVSSINEQGGVLIKGEFQQKYININKNCFFTF